LTAREKSGGVARDLKLRIICGLPANLLNGEINEEGRGSGERSKLNPSSENSSSQTHVSTLSA
jgi:hypothetical protein